MTWAGAALAVVALACNLPNVVPTPTNPPPQATGTSPPPVSPAQPPADPTRSARPTATATELVPSSMPPAPVANIDALLRTCPGEAELGRLEVDFEIVFDPAVALPPYACVDGRGADGMVNPRLTVYQALRAVNALRFDAPLPWTDLSLYDWLGEAIDGLVLTTTDVSYCCDEGNRIVLKADLLSQPQLAVWYEASSGIGLMGLVGLMVHEARHAEIGGHTCGNDDQTLAELGAWGVQYWLFTWMAEHAPAGLLSEEQAAAALGHAQTALARICNP